MKATKKATNVAAQAKKPGKAAPSVERMVAFCVAAFADYMVADHTLQNAKALWDAARIGLRTELARAHRVIGDGKPWDRFKADTRAALVKAGVCDTVKAAGRLIDNALIALGLTGKGTRKGGKRKGAGRPEKVKMGAREVDARTLALWISRALPYLAKAQDAAMADERILEPIGRAVALLGGGK